MAFDKGQATVTLEVVPAPGAFLAATPASRKVARGDLASFDLTISPKAGYTGPVFLRVVNLAGSHSFSVNPVTIPPEGTPVQSVLNVETEGFDPASTPLELAIEAVDVLPEGEQPA